MTPLDAWFPYPSFRPHQQRMLEVAASCAREGGLLLVDAPTGSGKSSVAAALLAGKEGRKILIAVRTVSQLGVFLRELELIRQKRPDLTYSYLIGKGSLCPMGGRGDTYRRCEALKSLSTSLIRNRADAGSRDPGSDPVIKRQIRMMDRDNPVICPYFIHSRIVSPSDSGPARIIPSPVLKAKAARLLHDPVPPSRLTAFCDPLCPYEVLLAAATPADITVLNHHHVFSREIRDQLYENLGLEASQVILLIDEAHNCGESVESIQSISLAEEDLEAASRELSGLAGKKRGAEAIRHVIPRISAFLAGLRNSPEAEDWFDPAIFDRMVVRGSLYRDMDAIVEDAMVIAEYIHEQNTRAGEYRESAVERLTRFLFQIASSSDDPSYLTVYRQENGVLALEARNIDPSPALREIASAHHATALISGTLTPVESYRRLYFGDLPTTTLTLPNTFPPENRLVLCTRDITTAYRKRQDRANEERIAAYIKAFAGARGNLAVYFPSYQILERFAGIAGGKIQGKEVICEPRDSRDAADLLRHFLSLPGGGRSGILFAVCGGKWSEGLDYRGDLLSGAMVVGLPLAPFNRVRRMVIDYYTHRFGPDGEFLSYTLPAIHRSQQALGRVLRSPEDRGILVFGDERFLEERTRRGLPSWIAEEMVPCDLARFSEMIRSWR